MPFFVRPRSNGKTYQSHCQSFGVSGKQPVCTLKLKPAVWRFRGGTVIVTSWKG